MKTLNIIDINKYIDKDILVDAVVDNIRSLAYVIFIILRDSSGKVQVTIEKSDENMLDILKTLEYLTCESTVKIKGKVQVNEHVKLGGYEIIPTSIEVTSLSDNELPIDIKNKDNAFRETRLDYRFLDLRRSDNNLFFKCQTFIESKMREYWINNNYMEIHTPKISSKAAESGAEEFKLDYFGETAVLSQSPQFYKQMAISSGFEKVFEIGTVYRAENSHTSYHACEIEMIDSEIGYIDSYEEVMDEEEKMIKYFMTSLKEKYGDKIKNEFNTEVSDVTENFPRINFYDAKNIIKDKYNYISITKEDFDRHDEELICSYAKNEYNSDFVFITNYPYSARSFYIMKDKDGITQSFDLLFKGLEITSGGQREHRYDVLKKQIVEKGIDPSVLDFYIEFFKYGCAPHGGYGLGMARLMMKIFNIDNVREATFLYRGPTRLRP
ncbi:MAG: aspartate--tRNA(Asn) ligase [Bacilli bacterium]